MSGTVACSLNAARQVAAAARCRSVAAAAPELPVCYHSVVRRCKLVSATSGSAHHFATSIGNIRQRSAVARHGARRHVHAVCAAAAVATPPAPKQPLDAATKRRLLAVASVSFVDFLSYSFVFPLLPFFAQR